LADGQIHAELENKTRQFVERLSSALAGTTVNIARMASIFWIAFQRDLPRSASTIDGEGIARYNGMHDSILRRGIYLPPSGYEVCFVSAAHTDEMLNQAADKLASLIE
jgi:glutamate-1-semialdehyde 2,1-aminomutase